MNRIHRLPFVCMAVIAAALIGATPSAALAADPPWRPDAVEIVADKEPLSFFLLRLLSNQRINGVVSESVGLTPISGRFARPAAETFRSLATQFGLTWYYDGAALHVYGPGETQTKVFSLPPDRAARLEPLLATLRFDDRRFPIRISPQEGYVVVAGPPRYVTLVGEVVELLSRERIDQTSAMTVRVFRLQNAWAQDTTVSIGGVATSVPGVATTLNEILASSAYSRVSQPLGSRSKLLPRTEPGLRGRGLNSVGRPGAGEAPSDGATQGAGVEGGSRRDPVQDDARGTAPGAPGEQPTVPAFSVAIAYPRLNAVVIRDAPEKMAMYEALIRDLDRPAPLIEIEASIIDVSVDKADALGASFRLSGSALNIISSGRPLSATDLAGGRNPVSAGNGGVATIVVGSDRAFLAARLTALEQSGDASVISRPRVLGLGNIEAVLSNSREFFVRVPGFQQTDLYNVSSGLVLRVTPMLIEEGGERRYRLRVRVQDGSAVPGATVDQIPVIERNEITTEAIVGEGESLLLGGYIVEQRSSNLSGLPVLSRLPGIGWLFGERTTQSRRAERMFLITPRLVSDSRSVQ